MKTIRLSMFLHQQKQQIKIDFSFDYKIKEHVKQFKGVTWSATHKTYYTIFSKENANNFCKHLIKKGYKVDYNALKRASIKKEKLPALKTNFQLPVTQFKNWMTQKRYSENTIKTYTSMIELFFRFHSDKQVNEIDEKNILDFNINYIIANNYSSTFQNQLINALKLFYLQTINKSLNLDGIERPKRSKRLPQVLSIDEVKEILNSIKNTKHITLISLLYSCGLRIGEAINLKTSSVDLNRKLLHVKSGKGNKDRYIPLSSTMITLLEKYYKLYRPKDFVFEGQNSPKYSTVSARQVLKNSLKKTNIIKRVTLHTLRHSYATHLLENGTDIRFIQELLGHNSPKTTMIYTHVSTTSLEKIKNPFDDFNI